MSSLLISIILLGANVLLFIYALSSTIAVPVTLILLLMACVLFANIYKQGTEFIRLEEQARRNKKIILQQKKEVKANQDKLKHILDELAKKDKGRIDEELGKVTEEKEKQEERFRQEYWDQLERSANVSEDPEAAKKLKELEVGQVLEVLADDVGIKEDMPAWCRTTGNELLGIEEEAGGYKVYIKKSR